PDADTVPLPDPSGHQPSGHLLALLDELAVGGAIALLRDHQGLAVAGPGGGPAQVAEDRLAQEGPVVCPMHVAQLSHCFTPLTLSSVRCKVEAIRCPPGSADSPRKGWPPKVGNGRKAAQKTISVSPGGIPIEAVSAAGAASSFCSSPFMGKFRRKAGDGAASLLPPAQLSSPSMGKYRPKAGDGSSPFMGKYRPKAGDGAASFLPQSKLASRSAVFP